MQSELSDDPQKIGRSLLLIGKVLLNLEMKLGRLEAINEKLVDAYDQGIDPEAAEQFQTVLDKDHEFTYNIIDKISQLRRGREETLRRDQ